MRATHMYESGQILERVISVLHTSASDMGLGVVSLMVSRGGGGRAGGGIRGMGNIGVGMALIVLSARGFMRVCM